MLIGVLALQGTFIEHYNSLCNLKEKNNNLEVILVKRKDEINKIDGLVIPGGESTTIRKLLKMFDLYETLKMRIENGLPVYGTCAGLILLAKHIVSEDSYLNAIDITVKRNAFGSQIDSFKTKMNISEFGTEPTEGVFIRAPWIEKVGKNVKILATYQNKIVAACEKNILVTSFHPEFTDNLLVHQYFINMVKKTLTK